MWVNECNQRWVQGQTTSYGRLSANGICGTERVCRSVRLSADYRLNGIEPKQRHHHGLLEGQSTGTDFTEREPEQGL